MKHDDASNGVRHFGELLALAQRLRESDIALYRHDWHCLVMGSWSIIAGIRHRSFLFSWDGRDGFICVQGPFHVVHGTPVNAPCIANERLGIGSTVDPLRYIETFFCSHRDA